ncbi:hypothetical protein B0H34DRAFT_734667 [Crassisporium funariophilum]|nr:hypothetical protein B0H34DRAFT_734667 [Crassisporium funariophilum]
MAKPGVKDPIVRHPEFYFPDGSVVLIVERTAFRVHQSVLARHSEVFNGMWDVPQPPQVDMYDGCPTVWLTDSKNDFTDVMRVLYDAFYFDKLKPDSPLTTLIAFISGLLRISTKYDMQQLRQKCISIIQDKFPSTLAGCDMVLSRQYKYIPAEIVRVIPLARETNVATVLPWAFYLCAQIGVDDILKDPVLSWRDKALCLAGKEFLWEAQKSNTHKFLLEFNQALDCPHNCHRSVASNSTMTWQNAEIMRITPHPLEEYVDWKDVRVCRKCLDMVMLQHRIGREKVWEKLPSYFQLGTWDDIIKDQSC